MTFRAYDRRGIKNPLEQLVADLCADAGVRFLGIQPMLIPTVPALAMFLNAHGSACGVPIEGLSVAGIRARADASDLSFELAEAQGRFTAEELQDAVKFLSVLGKAA